MKSFSDPESLHNRSGVPFREETRSVSQDEFESVVRNVDSHAAVGITDDEGNVLLVNDGSHGWTLIARPVDAGEDWTTAARREAERLLDDRVDLEGIELVRRIEFHTPSDEGRRTSMYNVVFRASVDGVPVIEVSGTEDDDPSLGWFERVPDGQDGNLADDIRLFVE